MLRMYTGLPLSGGFTKTAKMNLEISNAVVYGAHSAIHEQVQNGVAVRMALLDLTLNGGQS